MPRFRVTLSDGRIVTLEADQQPTEADVLMAIGQQSEPAAAPAPKPDGETDAHGNRIVRNPDGSVKFMQGPGYRGTTEGRPDSNVATIGGFGIAPEDVLAAPSLARGAGRLISAGASVLRRPLAGALDVGATVLDNPIVGMISPRAQQAGQLMGRAAPVLRGAPVVAEAAAPVVAEAIVPAAAEAVAPRLATATTPSKAMQAAREAFATAGETARPAEASNVMELIRRGKEPQEALRLVLSKRPAAAVTQEVATVAEKMPKLTASEVKAGMDLIARGKTPQQAMDAILAQREFLAKMGGGAVTDDAAKAALDLRNARGQIKTPSAQTAELRRGR